MRSRRVILVTCAIVYLLLCIDGLSALMSIDKRRYRNEAETQKNNNILYAKYKEESSTAYKEPINILLIGLDKDEVRSDVILIANADLNSGKIKILSVPRDTLIRIKNHPAKINATYGFEQEKLLITTVEDMTDLNIDYYLTLNFEGFKKAIDTLGGVEFNVPFDMYYDDPYQDLHINLRKGYQTLDGDKAEQLVRYRKGNSLGEGYTDGDLGRIKVQQDLIKEMIKQKLKIKYLSKVDDIFFILKRYMKSNIEIGDIHKHLMFIKSIKYENVEMFTLPGESEYIYNAWYFIYDRKGLEDIVKNNFAQ